MRYTSARVLSIIFIVAIFAPYSTLDAQFLPSVTLDCTPLNVDLNSKEGESNTEITYCTLTNDSAWSEEIDISVDVETIQYAAPSSVTVPAGGEMQFEVVWRTDVAQTVAEHNFTITASISSVNGIPLDMEGDSNDGMIYLIQYGAEDLFIQVGPNVFGASTEFQVVCDVSNDGNGEDTIVVKLNNGNDLAEQGFIIDSFTQSVKLSPGDDGSVTFTITTPETINEEQTIDLNFEAYSKIEKDRDSSYTGDSLIYAIIIEADESGDFFDPSSIDSSDAITGVIVVVGLTLGLMGLGIFMVILRKRKLNKALDFDFD